MEFPAHAEEAAEADDCRNNELSVLFSAISPTLPVFSPLRVADAGAGGVAGP